MSIIFSPFRLVFSLVFFALEFAIVMSIIYILAILGLVWLFGSIPEIVEVVHYLPAVEEIGSICDRIEGCRIIYENGKEICPDCK